MSVLYTVTLHQAVRNTCLVLCCVRLMLPLLARADDRPEYSGSPVYNDTEVAHYIGDLCRQGCSAILQHAFCNTSSRRCECLSEYPVVIDNLICEQPRRLAELCRYDRVCQFSDENSRCRSSSEVLAPRCRCRQHYRPSAFQTGSAQMYCIKDPLSQILEPDASTVLGTVLVLAAMVFLTCMGLKLFHRARHVRSRGYGDANLPPPLSRSETEERCRCHEQSNVSCEAITRCADVRPVITDRDSTAQSHLLHATAARAHARAATHLNGHAVFVGDASLLHVDCTESERRLSGSSVHSSFSTCTYGLPESIANRMRAQKNSQARAASSQVLNSCLDLTNNSVSVNSLIHNQTAHRHA